MIDTGEYEARKTTITANNDSVFYKFRERLHKMLKIDELDNFTRHYLIAMLWSSNDESDENGGEPLDFNYSLYDIAPCAIQSAIDDCLKFQRENAEMLTRAYSHYIDSGMAAHPDAGTPQACAGHDFWLTRCGHGVGFWDRGMSDLGQQLTAACDKFGNVEPYVGEDGLIYFT